MPMIAPDSPSTNPVGGSAPFQNINVSADSFGASVGAAEKGLGSAMEGTGDMLARHAVQFQQQENEATVNTALVQHDIAAGQLINNYEQLTGKAKADAYPDHVKALEALRAQGRSALPNAETQRAFDQQTMRQFGYQVVNASREAASSLRTYQSAAASARLNTTIDAAARLQDDKQFQDSISEKNIREIIQTDPVAKFQSEDVIQQEVRKRQSEAWQSRIQSTSYGDPVRALEMLRANKDKVDPTRIAGLEHQVTQQVISTQAGSIATESVGGGGDVSTVAGREKDAVAKLSKVVGKVGAAGIVGGWRGAENVRLEPAAVNRGDGADGSDSIGYGQWNQDRAEGLKKLMKENPGMSAHDANIAWAAKELGPGGKYAAVGEALRNAKTPEEAARIAQDRYEVPADKEATIGARTAHAVRLAGIDISERPPGAYGPGEREAIVTAAQDKARAQATKLGLNQPDTETFVNRAEQLTRAKYGQVQADYRDGVQGAKLDVHQALFDPADPPKTIDDLFKKGGKSVQDAYNALPEKEQHAIGQQLARNANNPPLTPEREALFRDTIGKSYDPESRREFMDIASKAAALDLPTAQQNQIITRARELQKDINKPAPVNSAMTQLQNSGMFAGTPILKKGVTRNQYMAALNEALTTEQQVNQGPIPADKVAKIGREVFNSMQQHHWYGNSFDKSSPPADIGARAVLNLVPEVHRNTILQAYTKANPGQNPNPRQIYEIYTNPKNRGMFMKFPGPTTSAAVGDVDSGS